MSTLFVTPAPSDIDMSDLQDQAPTPRPDDTISADQGPTEGSNSNSTEVAKTKRSRLGVPVVASAFNTPHPASTRRAQRSKADAPGIASKREEERQRRWVEYGFAIDDFDHATKKSQEWYQFSQGQRLLWGNERKRLAKRIPQLEEELAKAHEDLDDMKAAEDKMEEKYGEQIENGRVNTETLEGYRGFLALQHDREPTELVEDE